MISAIKNAFQSGVIIAVRLSVIGIAIAALLVAGLFVVSWLSTRTPERFVCNGTYLAISGDEKTRYPQSRLGVEFVEPTWLGKTLFDLEPNYEYVVSALPHSAGAASQRDSGYGLSYSELTDGVIFGDKNDDILGRTMLNFERLNGYLGLSHRIDSDGFIWGFDFDGFCDEK